MQTTARKRRRKGVAAAAVVAVAAALALGGTIAWQSISQTALNEVQGSLNPGARLHDDFDGSNKDVYVENFTSAADGGMPIFARVRLAEYLELGEDAGKSGEGRDVTVVTQGAQVGDKTTWPVYKPTAESLESGTPGVGEYWKWAMGGQTSFMPTFNMNKDSLASDRNGTFAGPDGADGESEGDEADCYADYVKWEVGQTSSGYEIHDHDADGVDEAAGEEPAIDYGNYDPLWSTEGIDLNPDANDGADIVLSAAEVEHVAKATHDAQVISMEAWKAAGSPIGDFWVADVDGWFYWADAILPGEATGLLLSGITPGRLLAEDYYYAINVEGQFCTAGDWNFTEQDGGEPSADALYLLELASGSTVSIDVSAQDGSSSAAPGSTLSFNAKVTLGALKLSDEKLTWSIALAEDGQTLAEGTAISEGTLTVGESQPDGTLIKVRASLKDDPSIYDEVTIRVAGGTPSDGDDVSGGGGAGDDESQTGGTANEGESA